MTLHKDCERLEVALVQRGQESLLATKDTVASRLS
jgi:hypothetical protein